MSCPFCSTDTEKNRILMERTRIVVILSNPRLMEGHTLVIPRRHVSSLSALSVLERLELFETAIHFQEKIKRVFTKRFGQTAGCDLSQHDRLFMPSTELTVPMHVHIHLRPRFWNDPYSDARDAGFSKVGC